MILGEGGIRLLSDLPEDEDIVRFNELVRVVKI